MGTRTEPLNILVCEDENFQRLALLDLLSMCDYETVAAENGKQAMDQLNNECNNFDLVLLDLNMPEMDGFEVMTHMQADERLKQIPVVVMSANDSQVTVSKCLKLGAKNFLVKPVRISECRALPKYVVNNPKPNQEEKGLARFEVIKHLGQGAAGTVHLVRNKKTDEELALKTMNLQYLSDKDKESAECEVEFLRVISGPTIIKFYESFVEKNSLYIVMEYADGGCLGQLIQNAKKKKTTFSDDSILMYTAQITLSLLALHSKQILHRDIKTQNIFIKQGVLKLGDFGISKSVENDMAKTMCGTPYFMPPEVCEGRSYDAKADVWAMGVIIYELLTLKKPFDSNTIQGVFEAIKNKPLDPLPAGTSKELQSLIEAVLNKNNEKRPSIFDVAKIPCVSQKIQQFIEEQDCKEEVMAYFDLDSLKKAEKQPEKKQSTVNAAEALADLLEEYSEEMRQEVSIKDYPCGWFSKHLHCTQGKEIYQWIKGKVEEKKKAGQMCQKLLEKEYITCVEEGKGRIFNVNNLYRFHMDRDDIADNLIKKGTGEPGDAMEVSQKLVTLATELYQQAIIENEDEDEEEEDTIDVEAALRSPEYKAYLEAASELETIDIIGLSQSQRVAVLLNVYQAMYVHHFLRRVSEEGTEEELQPGLMSTLKSYVFDSSQKQFYYNIGGLNFTLQELKHGLLRGNQKAPENYMASLSSSDNRLDLLRDFSDPRINFICLDHPNFLEHIDPMEGGTEEELEESMDNFLQEIISAKASIDLEEGSITLPPVLQKYRADFGGTDEAIIEFVFRYMDEDCSADQETVVEMVRSKQVLITYE